MPPLKDSSGIIRTALLDIPELRSDYHPPKNSKCSDFLEELKDSFSNLSVDNTQQKLVSVCSAHKNTAGNLSATLTGSSATVVKHGATILRHSSQIASTASSLAPFGSAVGSGICLVKDAHTQEIIEARLFALEKLYHQVAQIHYPLGVPPLEPHIPLSELHSPGNHSRSACETMLHTLSFAIGNTQKRIQRLKIQQVGSGVVMAGATAAAAGSFFLGVGAIPGIAISATGTAINLAPTVEGIGRAAYKKIKQTKGVIRKSSAQFIWALALHKAVSEKLITQEELRETNEATGAFCLATEWHYLRDQEDMNSAQHIAHLFLKNIGILNHAELVSLECLQKIENRLKSTPNV